MNEEDQQRVAWLRQRRMVLQRHIDRLLPHRDDGLTQHFHLGMVGGSGRNVRRLNKRRERSLDALITRSTVAAPLIEEKQRIEQEIVYITSGQAARQREADQRAQEMKVAIEQKRKAREKAMPRVPMSREAREFLRGYPADYKERRPCTVCGGMTTWVLYLDKESQITTFACWHHAQQSLMPKENKDES